MTKIEEKKNFQKYVDASGEREFVPLEETEFYKKSLEFEKTLSAEEIQAIKDELEADINRHYDDEDDDEL